MKKISLLLFLASFLACNPTRQSEDEIIKSSVAYHGGVAYDTLTVKYKFRDKYYFLDHDNGLYTYKRIFKDTLGNRIEDILTNEGFERIKSGQKINLSSKDSAAYANSVNSVHYFALLPYNLQDEAVVAHTAEDILIKGEPFKSVEVKFHQEGGGTDHEDEFMFWFSAKDYQMKYFAYRYHTDGGGVRFREVINEVREEGVLFQDYNNFKADKDVELNKLPIAFEKDELELLSKIELEFVDDIL